MRAVCVPAEAWTPLLRCCLHHTSSSSPQRLCELPTSLSSRSAHPLDAARARLVLAGLPVCDSLLQPLHLGPQLLVLLRELLLLSVLCSSAELQAALAAATEGLTLLLAIALGRFCGTAGTKGTRAPAVLSCSLLGRTGPPEATHVLSPASGPVVTAATKGLLASAGKSSVSVWPAEAAGVTESTTG